jgi:hypothetical protein
MHGKGWVPFAAVVTQLLICLTKGGLKPQPQPLCSGQHKIKLCGALPPLPIEIVRILWKQQTTRERTPTPQLCAEISEGNPAVTATAAGAAEARVRVDGRHVLRGDVDRVPPRIQRQQQILQRPEHSVCQGSFAVVPANKDDDDTDNSDKLFMSFLLIPSV